MGYKAVPLRTIYQPNGNPYISVIEDDKIIRIQLHSYDEHFKQPMFLVLDKRVLPQFCEILQGISMSPTQETENATNGNTNPTL
jgi:hypothetical protein